MDRRRWMIGTGAGLLGASWMSQSHAAPQAKLLDTRVISHLKHRYHGWPTLAQRKSGELVLVCSGGREAHVCPFGRVELMRSGDEGKTWSWPEVVLDGPIDDRDAGILETAKGTLLVTTFTSLAYEGILKRAEAAKNWEAAKLARWQAAHNRVDSAGRQQALHCWMTRSTDGGLTWSRRYKPGLNSPHGPIQLADDRLLYAGKTFYSSEVKIGVSQSTDDGKSWKWLAEIPTRDGDDPDQYHELHAVQSGDRLIAHVRNHNKRNAGETLQSISDDGGESWSKPKSIGVWGLPSHLLRLRDGRLLMSYGHRRRPLGNQVRVSADDGATWSAALHISSDGNSGDLGYPSTVELKDGSLLTVWYEKMKGSSFAVLRQCRWKLA